MSEGKALFEINPAIDVGAARQRFSQSGRVQIRDVLTDRTAKAIRDILLRGTPWGLAWRAGADGPHALRAADIGAMASEERGRIASAIDTTMRGQAYGFLYGQYPLVDAYLGGWAPGSPHDLLLEYINTSDVLDLIRNITGLPEILKADAQATLFAPTHFLALHDDLHAEEGRKVAYVLGLGMDDWRPEWGGYLLFHSEDGDVVDGFRPRFNALNLFRVPMAHSVSYVPPFAPAGRVSITGWFRDR